MTTPKTSPTPTPAAVVQPAPATPAAVAVAQPKPSPVLALALLHGFADALSFAATLKATIMPGNSTDAQVAMLCSVALSHGLNPLKREIYAFPDKGGIRPIIGVDGWYTIANSHAMFDGIRFEFAGAKDDKSLSCTCFIYRKDRQHPVEVTEYLDECFRATEPWKQATRRMLRHRAAIQAIRIAFGLAGAMDEEEYERMVEFETISSKRPNDDRPRTASAAIAQLSERRAQPKVAEPTTVTVEAVRADPKPEPEPEATVEQMADELFPVDYPPESVDPIDRD